MLQLRFFFCFILLFGTNLMAQDFEEWDKLVKKTDVENLEYRLSDIVVRSFDGVNPPPRLDQKERMLFYSYGMTAYWIDYQLIKFFEILHLEAVHRDSDGKEIRRFPMAKEYSDEFKSYFRDEIPAEEKKKIFFENIYLKDEQENYIKLTQPQPFCPHCFLVKEEE